MCPSTSPSAPSGRGAWPLTSRNSYRMGMAECSRNPSQRAPAISTMPTKITAIATWMIHARVTPTHTPRNTKQIQNHTPTNTKHMGSKPPIHTPRSTKQGMIMAMVPITTPSTEPLTITPTMAMTMGPPILTPTPTPMPILTPTLTLTLGWARSTAHSMTRMPMIMPTINQHMISITGIVPPTRKGSWHRPRKSIVYAEMPSTRPITSHQLVTTNHQQLITTNHHRQQGTRHHHHWMQSVSNRRASRP